MAPAVRGTHVFFSEGTRLMSVHWGVEGGWGQERLGGGGVTKLMMEGKDEAVPT